MVTTNLVYDLKSKLLVSSWIIASFLSYSFFYNYSGFVFEIITSLSRHFSFKIT
jgi:hypothetical protein